MTCDGSLLVDCSNSKVIKLVSFGLTTPMEDNSALFELDNFVIPPRPTWHKVLELSLPLYYSFELVSH